MDELKNRMENKSPDSQISGQPDKSLHATPVANRTHIGFFGRMNVGKSSLINALARQSVSIVSEKAGTTTDVVRKTMEIHGIGPCVLLDTAGFDDTGDLGDLRTAASRKAAAYTDIAVILFSDTPDWTLEKEWIRFFTEQDTPVIVVLSDMDQRTERENQALCRKLKEETGFSVILASAYTGEGIEQLKEALITSSKESRKERFIMGNLVKRGDLVLLVMPQDPQAPQGRLILPEVQTIREALDRQCTCMCVQPEELSAALSMLNRAPDLIVTDSQVFEEVYQQKPEETKLTSFSVLFAGYKGDIRYYLKSADAIANLKEDSRVLIAECCTHAPLDEDIGRVKIPGMLKKRAGAGLQVDVCAGADFPEDLKQYDLIIQCGGCMFNRKYVCSRIRKAREAEVPMTNYGITIAWLKGILDRVETGADAREL